MPDNLGGIFNPNPSILDDGSRYHSWDQPIWQHLIPGSSSAQSSGFDDGGSFDPLTGIINPTIPNPVDDIFGPPTETFTDPKTGEPVEVPLDDRPSPGDIEPGLSEYGSSSKDNLEGRSVVDEYLKQWKISGDDAWFEKYLDTIIERENVASARKYETEMSNTAYTRALSDIKNAGYNPWLLLQGSGSNASTPSVTPASASGISVSSQSTSRRNQNAQMTSEIIARVISAVGIAAAALISKLLFKV